jgi:hypothetical protein
MPPFIKFIEMRQKLSESWMMEVLKLGAAYQRAVMIRRRASEVTIKIVWPALTDDDNRLTLDALKWAYASGLIDDENAIRLMPLSIDNPEEMLQRLRSLAATRDTGDAFDAAMRRDAAGDADAEMYWRYNGHNNPDEYVIASN